MQSLEDQREDTVDLIPAVEGATDYYAMVKSGGRLVLAKLDNGKWRAVQQSEMLSILGANGINPNMLNPMAMR